MKRNFSIQLKAASLLLVFGCNTLTGFACAIGINFNFNVSHHQKVEAGQISANHHDEAEAHHHNKKNGSKKDDCCNDKVVKLIQTDKTVPQTNSLISPVFLTALISSFVNVNVLSFSQTTTSIKHFVRCYHPPISNIRIAIQSFQI